MGDVRDDAARSMLAQQKPELVVAFTGAKRTADKVRSARVVGAIWHFLVLANRVDQGGESGFLKYQVTRLQVKRADEYESHEDRWQGEVSVTLPLSRPHRTVAHEQTLPDQIAATPGARPRRQCSSAHGGA